MVNTYYTKPIEKTERISKLVAHLFAKMPEIEAAKGGTDHGVLSGDGRTAHYDAQGEGI